MTTRSYSLIPRQYYLVDYYDRRSALDNDVDEVSGFRSRDRLRRRTTAILLSPFMNRIHHVSLHLHRDWLSGVGGLDQRILRCDKANGLPHSRTVPQFVSDRSGTCLRRRRCWREGPTATARSTWAILRPSRRLSVARNLQKLEMTVMHVTPKYPLDYVICDIDFPIIPFTTLLLLLD